MVRRRHNDMKKKISKPKECTGILAGEQARHIRRQKRSSPGSSIDQRDEKGSSERYSGPCPTGPCGHGECLEFIPFEKSLTGVSQTVIWFDHRFIGLWEVRGLIYFHKLASLISSTLKCQVVESLQREAAKRQSFLQVFCCCCFSKTDSAV